MVKQLIKIFFRTLGKNSAALAEKQLAKIWF